MKKILVTGANGFVGSAIMRCLQRDAYSARGALRSNNSITNVDADHITVGDLNRDCDWSRALDGVEVVIHTAARAHIMRDTAADPLRQYLDVNLDGTLNLAFQAVDAGVRRFIFISSIKINGEETRPGCSFSADDDPNPTNPYAISKLRAEQDLLELGAETAIEVVIIRPPLVYGPGIKANFLSMMRWINSGVPLPLGAIHNKRSLVALDNLVDLIITCIEHSAAANQTFLVSDGEDLSTTELLQRISRALGKPARLIPFPVSLLTFVASLLGKKEAAQRLCGSLQVDISKARELLGWEPPVSVEEGLRKVAEDFMKNKI